MRSFCIKKNRENLMKGMKTLPLLLIFSAILSVSFSQAYSDSLRISQIDSNSLLINQNVRAYVSVTDIEGSSIKDLDRDNFKIFETAEGRPPQEFKVIRLEQGVNINRGINLLLILDNSGSMYWDASGKIKNSEDESLWRITFAKEAIISFLKEIKNPRDRVGLFVFNVKIGQKTELTDDKVKIVKALSGASKPPEDEAYTELYETLYQGIDYLRTARGRKVIIVLSDGQNFPMDNNPHFSERKGLEGAIDFAQREGISVFTIGLSSRADRKNLTLIAEETGGAYFWVYDPGQLENLYNLIRDQVLNEYLLTYRAGMIPSEKKLLKIIYTNGGETEEAARYYFTGTLFGIPGKKISYLIFLFIPVSIILLWLLSLIKFQQKSEIPSLSVQTSSGKKTIVHTLHGAAKQSEVTIGASSTADITIAGDPKIAKKELTITGKNGVFTIRSKTNPVTVNNRPVKTKVLRSGDLIKIGDTTVVFDRGTTKP
jgi:Ca-activated chloride channel family protein